MIAYNGRTVNCETGRLLRGQRETSIFRVAAARSDQPAKAAGIRPFGRWRIQFQAAKWVSTVVLWTHRTAFLVLALAVDAYWSKGLAESLHVARRAIVGPGRRTRGISR
jgi:hypothetical protein